MSYQDGKIYMIESLEGDVRYIGSTRGSLRKRLSGHKSCFKMWQDKRYHYISSFDVLKFADVKIMLVENFPCDHKDALQAREAYHISEMSCVNLSTPGSDTTSRRGDIESIKKHCPTCDCSVRYSDFARHTKRNKHIRLINANDEQNRLVVIGSLVANESAV